MCLLPILTSGPFGYLLSINVQWDSLNLNQKSVGASLIKTLILKNTQTKQAVGGQSDKTIITVFIIYFWKLLLCQLFYLVRGDATVPLMGQRVRPTEVYANIWATAA